ncbi:MAG: NOL1/NOP2/sun family putative RNA methylase, partial [Candidatus Woesearchaeota archaeon]
DFDRFMEYSQKYRRRAIRVNTIKIDAEGLKKRLSDWELMEIPWCKEGFWIRHKREERRDIGNLAEHSLGYFYVQEAVSMIPPVVLNPMPGDLVLDMSAAPGSKATQMAAMMENTGLLVANDYKGKRLAALGINIQRMGIANTVVTLMHGQRMKGMYDKILLDAPCSGTGTIRKSLKTLQIWNPLMIKRLAKTQKQLIKQAFDSLKPQGTLVYSTCSIDPEENESVIDWLLQQGNAELLPIKLNINRSEAVAEFEGKIYSPVVEKCLRLWPQDNDTEGFFVAHIRKQKEV